MCNFVVMMMLLSSTFYVSTIMSVISLIIISQQLDYSTAKFSSTHQEMKSGEEP